MRETSEVLKTSDVFGNFNFYTYIKEKAPHNAGLFWFIYSDIGSAQVNNGENGGLLCSSTAIFKIPALSFC